MNALCCRLAYEDRCIRWVCFLHFLCLPFIYLCHSPGLPGIAFTFLVVHWHFTVVVSNCLVNVEWYRVVDVIYMLQCINNSVWRLCLFCKFRSFCRVWRNDSVTQAVKWIQCNWISPTFWFLAKGSRNLYDVGVMCVCLSVHACQGRISIVWDPRNFL